MREMLLFTRIALQHRFLIALHVRQKICSHCGSSVTVVVGSRMMLTSQGVLVVTGAANLLIGLRNTGFQKKVSFSVLVDAGLNCVLVVDVHVVVGALRRVKRMSRGLDGCIVLVMGVGRSFVLTVVGHIVHLVFAKV